MGHPAGGCAKLNNPIALWSQMLILSSPRAWRRKAVLWCHPSSGDFRKDMRTWPFENRAIYDTCLHEASYFTTPEFSFCIHLRRFFGVRFQNVGDIRQILRSFLHTYECFRGREDSILMTFSKNEVLLCTPPMFFAFHNSPLA